MLKWNMVDGQSHAGGVVHKVARQPDYEQRVCRETAHPRLDAQQMPVPRSCNKVITSNAPEASNARLSNKAAGEGACSMATVSVVIAPRPSSTEKVKNEIYEKIDENPFHEEKEDERSNYEGHDKEELGNTDVGTMKSERVMPMVDEKSAVLCDGVNPASTWSAISRRSAVRCDVDNPARTWSANSDDPAACNQTALGAVCPKEASLVMKCSSRCWFSYFASKRTRRRKDPQNTEERGNLGLGTGWNASLGSFVDDSVEDDYHEHKHDTKPNTESNAEDLVEDVAVFPNMKNNAETRTYNFNFAAGEKFCRFWAKLCAIDRASDRDHEEVHANSSSSLNGVFEKSTAFRARETYVMVLRVTLENVSFEKLHVFSHGCCSALREMIVTSWNRALASVKFVFDNDCMFELNDVQIGLVSCASSHSCCSSAIQSLGKHCYVLYLVNGIIDYILVFGACFVVMSDQHCKVKAGKLCVIPVKASCSLTGITRKIECIYRVHSLTGK